MQYYNLQIQYDGIIAKNAGEYLKNAGIHPTSIIVAIYRIVYMIIDFHMPVLFYRVCPI